MLSWIRKRTGAWWVKALYIGIAITFFGGFGILSSTKIRACIGMEEAAGRQGGDPILATVDGDPILETEFNFEFTQTYQNQLSRLQEQFPNQPIPEGLLNRDKIRKETMKTLIRERLVLKEAKRLGITVNDQEVREEIGRLFTQGGQPFDPDQYRSFLASRGMTEARFEEIIRKDLTKTKVFESMLNAVALLPEEIEERYAFEHEKVKLEYAVLDPAVLAADVMPADTTAKKYYDAHLTDYYVGETRVVKYVSWDSAEVLPGVTATEAEIQKYYEDGKDRYLTVPEQVNAQLILIRVDRDAPQSDLEAASNRINDIYLEAMLPGADFNELVKKYSEDPSRDMGGETGWFVEAQYAETYNLPARDEEFEKTAFALQTGQVSEPFLDLLGFNIIKLTGQKPAEYTPLDKVKVDVANEVKHGKALSLLQDKAETVKAVAEGAGNDLDLAAAGAGRLALISDWFQALDEVIPDLPDSQAVLEEAFKLSPDQISDPIAGEDHVYLIQVVEIKPEERQATFAEARSRLVRILKPQTQLTAAAKKAQDYLGRVVAGELDLKALGEEAGFKVEVADFMARGQIAIPGLLASDTLSATVNGLDQDSPWPKEPLVQDQRVSIFHFLEAQPPDMSKFADEKVTVKDAYLRKKQMEIVEQWFKRLEAGRVKYTGRWDEIVTTGGG